MPNSTLPSSNESKKTLKLNKRNYSIYCLVWMLWEHLAAKPARNYSLGHLSFQSTSAWLWQFWFSSSCKWHSVLLSRQPWKLLMPLKYSEDMISENYSYLDLAYSFLLDLQRMDPCKCLFKSRKNSNFAHYFKSTTENRMHFFDCFRNFEASCRVNIERIFRICCNKKLFLHFRKELLCFSLIFYTSSKERCSISLNPFTSLGVKK